MQNYEWKEYSGPVWQGTRIKLHALAKFVLSTGIDKALEVSVFPGHDQVFITVGFLVHLEGISDLLLGLCLDPDAS